jgi:RNA polymerase sigma-70 factor (ECF subfamily)
MHEAINGNENIVNMKAIAFNVAVQTYRVAVWRSWKRHNLFSQIIKNTLLWQQMSIASEYNEKLLFQQIASGDTTAFRQIFDLYKERLFSTAFKLTKTQLASEEVTQEVFINLWVSRERLMVVDDPGAYIFRILYNCIHQYLKKETNRERIIQAAVQLKDPPVNTIEQKMDADESQRRINGLIENLPPQQKAVYKLSRLQGMKNDEIAAELNISPNTVKAHLSKGLETLRDHLRDVSFITSLLASFKYHSDIFN